jgi:voltage-dependent calcium channel
VVNFAGAGLENQIRLPDGDENDLSEDEEGKEYAEDLKQNLPVRGRTLGFLGPKSRLRIALFHFLVYP